MKLKQSRKMLVVLAACGFLNTFVSEAKVCITCDVPWSADCSTYTEVAIVSPTFGVPVNHTSMIASFSMVNCGPQCPSLIGNLSKAVAVNESISHSCTGSLTTTVGLKAGNDAVAKLELSSAYTTSSGWQKADTWTSTITVNWAHNVPACKIQGVDYYGNWTDGTFTTTGYIIANYYDWSAGWSNEMCNKTTSSAQGANKRYTNVTGLAVPDRDCPAGCRCSP